MLDKFLVLAEASRNIFHTIVKIELTSKPQYNTTIIVTMASMIGVRLDPMVQIMYVSK